MRPSNTVLITCMVQPSHHVSSLGMTFPYGRPISLPREVADRCAELQQSIKFGKLVISIPGTNIPVPAHVSSPHVTPGMLRKQAARPIPRQAIARPVEAAPLQPPAPAPTAPQPDAMESVTRELKALRKGLGGLNQGDAAIHNLNDRLSQLESRVAHSQREAAERENRLAESAAEREQRISDGISSIALMVEELRSRPVITQVGDTAPPKNGAPAVVGGETPQFIPEQITPTDRKMDGTPPVHQEGSGANIEDALAQLKKLKARQAGGAT